MSKRKQCTVENFNRIRLGMTYDQVVALMDSNGEVLSQIGIGDVNTVCVMWENDGLFDRRTIFVIFQNERVTVRSQFGL
jgi:hypothetical protein